MSSLPPKKGAVPPKVAEEHTLQPGVQYFDPSELLYGNARAYYQQQPETPAAVPANLADPDYQYFAEKQTEAVPHPAAYEAKRATRQMAHYFDVSQYQRRLDQAATPAPTAAPELKRKPTKKELEQFRKRKEERKKIRHRWLYE